jgi:hypothetical protein
MVQEHRCRHHLQISQLDPTIDHVLLFLDSDSDCCRDINNRVVEWSKQEVYRTGFDVICIEKEYESWLLAGIESLRGVHGISEDAASPEDLNRIKGAKGRITELMPRGTAYSETTDQAALTASVDLEMIAASSASFDRLLNKLRAAHASRCRSCMRF